MPEIVQENLWKNPGLPGMIVVTSNATLKKGNGALVMGRGAAFEATVKIPGIALECGKKVEKAIAAMQQKFGHAERKYGFVIVRPPTEERVGFGLFQVKYEFSLPALVPLIHFSANVLASYAYLYPGVGIRLNYPGVGNGHLPAWLVRPHLEILPNNVTICRGDQ